jgi:hypothetical protein
MARYPPKKCFSHKMDPLFNNQTPRTFYVLPLFDLRPPQGPKGPQTFGVFGNFEFWIFGIECNE